MKTGMERFEEIREHLATHGDSTALLREAVNILLARCATLSERVRAETKRADDAVALAKRAIDVGRPKKTAAEQFGDDIMRMMHERRKP